MLKIDGNNNITLTRGDTLTLTVAPVKDGAPYEPIEGDVIRFALAKGFEGEAGYQLITEKVIPNDTLTFTVTETDLAYKTYNYDVQITHSDGSVDTFISAKLTITGEVA